MIYPTSVPAPILHEDISPRKVTPPDGFKSFLPEQHSLVAPPTPSPRTNRSLDLTQQDFVIPKTIGSPEQDNKVALKSDISKTESMDSDMTTDSDEIEAQGQEILENGVTIDRSSAAFLSRSENDPEMEDESVESESAQDDLQDEEAVEGEEHEAANGNFDCDMEDHESDF